MAVGAAIGAEKRGMAGGRGGMGAGVGAAGALGAGAGGPGAAGGGGGAPGRAAAGTATGEERGDGGGVAPAFGFTGKTALHTAQRARTPPRGTLPGSTRYTVSHDGQVTFISRAPLPPPRPPPPHPPPAPDPAGARPRTPTPAVSPPTSSSPSPAPPPA